MSDLESTFLQRVTFWIENYTTRQLFKRNIFLKSMILKKKNFFRRHDVEEKINFKKQILKKKLRTKNHVLIQFTPENAHFSSLTCNFKNHDPEEEIFPKKHDFERKVFLKSMILKYKNFYFVRFGINFFTTRHVLNWIYTTRQLFKRNIYL